MNKEPGPGASSNASTWYEKLGKAEFDKEAAERAQEAAREIVSESTQGSEENPESIQTDDHSQTEMEPSNDKPETVVTMTYRERARQVRERAFELKKTLAKFGVVFSPDDGRPMSPEETTELVNGLLKEAEGLEQKAKEEDEARENRINEYLKYYPDAVVDIGKAYEMAMEGDKKETEAAKKERVAVDYAAGTHEGLIEGRVIDPDGAILSKEEVKKNFLDMIAESEELRKEAATIEDAVGEAYDLAMQPEMTPGKRLTGILDILKKTLEKLSGDTH